MKKDTVLNYIMQDSLGSTSGTADYLGASASTIKYFPFGDCRNSTGTIPTDKKFTGQRLDSTGLYFYNARYYDPAIGRFISADSVVQNPADPQSLNRYSYCLNNPLKYTDPSGHDLTWFLLAPFLAVPGVGPLIGALIILAKVVVLTALVVNYVENSHEADKT